MRLLFRISKTAAAPPGLDVACGMQLHESGITWFKNVSRRPTLCVSLFVVMTFCLASAGSRSNTQQNTIRYLYHARIPMGSESFAVKAWKSVLTVLASAENPRFEGWRREQHGDKD